MENIFYEYVKTMMRIQAKINTACQKDKGIPFLWMELSIIIFHKGDYGIVY